MTAISPIDGRYRSKAEILDSYYSEYALIRYRVKVEIEYFIALCELPLVQLQGVGAQRFDALRDIYRNFSLDDARKVKEIESVTNHDVKAVEYFIKEKFEGLGLSAYKEFIHFGLTSQDINNTSVPMLIRDSIHEAYLPLLDELVALLNQYAEDWKDIPMLAKTHGQPASPTRLGKEIKVFAYRLEQQRELLRQVPVSGKFGGATGNFNAHRIAFPNVDWLDFARTFLRERLGIEREEWTTQISNYDNLAALFDAMARINTVMLDLDRDMWQYISMEYFKQKIKAGEVGSSAMPHKVNPIDFENSEGNLGLANAILRHLAGKLPVSRLQRDLTDSTVLRNMAVAFGYVLVAYQSVLKGLGKISFDRAAARQELCAHPEVLAEAVQTLLRAAGYPHAYETLRDFTRGRAVTASLLQQFIAGLPVDAATRSKLQALCPENYLGRARELAEEKYD